MTTLAKSMTPVREQVDHLERRVGRKGLYLIGGAIRLRQDIKAHAKSIRFHGDRFAFYPT